MSDYRIIGDGDDKRNLVQMNVVLVAAFEPLSRPVNCRNDATSSIHRWLAGTGPSCLS